MNHKELIIDTFFIDIRFDRYTEIKALSVIVELKIRKFVLHTHLSLILKTTKFLKYATLNILTHPSS